MSTMCMIMEQAKKKTSNLEMQGVSVGRSTTSTSRWMPGNTLVRWQGRRMQLLSSMISHYRFLRRFLTAVPSPRNERDATIVRPLSTSLTRQQTIHFSTYHWAGREKTHSESIHRLLGEIDSIGVMKIAYGCISTERVTRCVNRS